MNVYNVQDGVKETIDICLLTHDNLGLTINCIEHLYNNTHAPFQLIIVDDSVDPTVHYIKYLQKTKDNITLIHTTPTDPPLTGNAKFNMALKEAKHKYFATVMNSIFVVPDWEIVAVQFLEQNPKVGTLGFKCLFPTGIIESAGIAMANYTPVDIGRDLPGHRLTTIYEVAAAQWAFALHRKEALEGNLEEDVFHGHKGWDDIDNCFVLRKNGWQVFYCGYGVAYHRPRATRGSNTAESFVQNRQNAEAFYKRWGYWDEFKKTTNKPADYQGVKTPEELGIKTQQDVKNQVLLGA